MNDDPKQAMEALIAALFRDILDLARAQGISVKQMREMLPAVQIRALVEAGLSQQEVMAESGYTRKWIRELLAEGAYKNGQHSPIDQFVTNWASDRRFPDRLEIDGDYPSFLDLHDCYGGDFTAPSMMKILQSRGIIQKENGCVILDPERKVTASSGVDSIKAAQASLTALLSTLRHNLSEDDRKRTERRMWSSSIPAEKLTELRAEMAELNAKHRKDILETLARYQVEPGQETVEYAPPVGVGLYWYERTKP
jgi:hypothetical protein